MSRDPMVRRPPVLAIPVTLGTLFLLSMLFFYLLNELLISLQVLLVAATLGGVFLVGAFVILGLAYLKGWWKRSNEKVLQEQEETRRRRLENDAIQVRILVSSKIVHTADPGQATYLIDVLRNITTPLHLQPGQVNGHYTPPALEEIQRWQVHQLAHGKRGNDTPALPQGEPAQLGDGLPPLLPVLLQAQRLIIGGGSDSGKSTLAKHLIAGRAEASQIVVIDPHSPSKVLGFNVIGAGRDYGAIALALESLELLMHERYCDVAAGLMGYFQHSRLSIFIDEWTGIIEAIPEAGGRLKTLLTESRKVNMFLTLLTHSTTLDGLGLPSAQLKKSALIVELVGGQGQPYRAFIHPSATISGSGQKARPVEYALPGRFPGWPQPAGEVVLELPDPTIIKVQKMHNEGASLRAMARELFGKENPNGDHLRQVKELLARAEAARKARRGRA